jgi:hypothetical protein
MNDWAELDRALGVIAASECAEVREDGQWLAEFSPLRVEIRRQAHNAVVHLWSNERNLTRRILGIKERSDGRVLLEVQRLGRTEPGRLEFLCGEAARPASRLSPGAISRKNPGNPVGRFSRRQH